MQIPPLAALGRDDNKAPGITAESFVMSFTVSMPMHPCGPVPAGIDSAILKYLPH